MTKQTKHKKRENIILAAMTLIAKFGFHDAPMSMIAEKAGVGIGTIYRYFKNRDMMIQMIYKRNQERLVAFLLENYPSDWDVKDCFFHICYGMMSYFISNPLCFKYCEQFHNSPYGLASRRERLFVSANQTDIFMDLYKRATCRKVIKNMPVVLFFNLAYAPIIWSTRDHIVGMVQLDVPLAKLIVTSCWDSVKI